MEFTTEKSQEQAVLLESLKGIASFLDTDYLTAVAKQLRSNASQYDTLAVLNTRYNPKHAGLRVKQAEILETIVKFVSLSKEVGQMKEDESKDATARELVQQMLGGL